MSPDRTRRTRASPRRPDRRAARRSPSLSRRGRRSPAPSREQHDLADAAPRLDERVRVLDLFERQLGPDNRTDRACAPQLQQLARAAGDNVRCVAKQAAEVAPLPPDAPPDDLPRLELGPEPAGVADREQL